MNVAAPVRVQKAPPRPRGATQSRGNGSALLSARHQNDGFVSATRSPVNARPGPSARPADVLTRAAATADFPSIRMVASADKREADAASFARRAASGVPWQALDAPVAATEETAAAAVERPVSPRTAEMLEHPTAGTALHPSLVSLIGPESGSLAGVRVHADTAANAAARELGTRAFTFGQDIYLSASGSALDIELMFHEIAHVLQGASGLVTDLAAAEDGAQPVADAVEHWTSEQIARQASELPPYRILCTILGHDIITGKPIALPIDARIAEVVRIAGYPTVAETLDKLKLFETVRILVESELSNPALTVRAAFTDLKAAAMSPHDMRAVVDKYVDLATAAMKRVANAVIAHVRKVMAPYAKQLIATHPEVGALLDLGGALWKTDLLTGAPVVKTQEDILRAVLILVGQTDAFETMKKNGKLAEVLKLFNDTVAAGRLIAGEVVAAATGAWAGITLDNLPNFADVIRTLFADAKRIIEKFVTLGRALAVRAFNLVKNSLLAWLSAQGEAIPGYRVIRVIIGKDPFTRKEVPSATIDFLKEMVLLVSDEDTVAKLDETHKLQEAADRIDAAKKKLGMTWALIEKTFLGVWNLVNWDTIKHPLTLFGQIKAEWGKPIGKIFDFVVTLVSETAMVMLQAAGFPFEILNRLIANVKESFQLIKKDPVGFLLNVLRVVLKGITQFLDNVGKHLLAGLTNWMLRGVRSLGITAPKTITVQSVITLVLDVLGLNMEVIWKKIGKRIGEKTVARLRAAPEQLAQAFAFVKEVQEGGIGVLWKKLSEKLSDVWSGIFDAAMSWLMGKLFAKATAKLVAYLAVPGLGQLMGLIDITLTAFQTMVQYAKDLLSLLDRVVQSITDIARGKLEQGANWIEESLASVLPMAIGALANLVGIGDLPEKIKAIILGVRETVDKAIDWMLDKAVAVARKVIDAVMGKGKEKDPNNPSPSKTPGMLDLPLNIPGDSHMLRSDGPDGDLLIHSAKPIKADLDDKLKADLKNIVGRRAAAAWKARPKGSAPPKMDETESEATVLGRIVSNLEKLGASGALFAPGFSAPGVGGQAKYKEQPQPVHQTSPSVTHIVSTELEHVIPFKLAATLWERLLGKPAIARGQAQASDQEQTTISIYRNAALLKTNGKLPIDPKLPKPEVAEDFDVSDRRAIRAGKNAVSALPKKPKSSDVPSKAFVKKHADAFLDAVETPAVARTIDAGAKDNAMIEKFTVGSRPVAVANLTNGARRGEVDTPTPTAAKVRLASKEQKKDIAIELEKSRIQLAEKE